jgi:hypothetical protein
VVNEARQHGLEHDRTALREYLRSLPSKSSIAVETIGSWYWLIDEMEAAGHHRCSPTRAERSY